MQMSYCSLAVNFNKLLQWNMQRLFNRNFYAVIQSFSCFFLTNDKPTNAWYKIMFTKRFGFEAGNGFSLFQSVPPDQKSVIFAQCYLYPVSTNYYNILSMLLRFI